MSIVSVAREKATTMNNPIKTARVMATAIVLAGTVALTTLVGQSTSVGAQNGGSHQSILQITYDDQLPTTRKARVGLNKSMIVELPRDLRDIVVSDPEILDAVVQTSNRVYLVARKIGQANAFFFDQSGARVLTLEITVERDVATLEGLLNRLIPGASIKVEIMNDTIILTGTVPNPVDANRASDIASRFTVAPEPAQNERYEQKVINMLAVQGRQQVLLKVTVAEMTREMIKRLGVNWNTAQTAGGSAFGFGTNNSFPLTSQQGASSFLFGVYGPQNNLGNCFIPGGLGIEDVVPPFSVSNGLFGAIPPALGANCVARTLEAFERNGLAKTLAEPTLTAISGETANFLAGGEFPIPIAQDNNAITVEWKPFGVGLSFTPLVMSERRISMKIATEVSELTNEGAVVLSGLALPGIKTRRANTTVELPSGGSLVMAGLISDKTKQNIDGLPGLKRLPIIGTLFRSRDFQKQETELVVIVTPLVVKPVGRNKLARPDENFMPASDPKGYLLGHLNRIYGRKVELPTGQYEGDVGFIIE